MPQRQPSQVVLPLRCAVVAHGGQPIACKGSRTARRRISVVRDARGHAAGLVGLLLA